MTELSVLERVRAAVAEAGYDPTIVVPDPEGIEDWSWDVVDDVPEWVIWRAREAVRHDRPLCLGCFSANASVIRDGTHIELCLADRRFVEDCGRNRDDNG